MLDGGEEKKCDVLTFEIPVYVENYRRVIYGGRQGLEKFQEIEACYISKLDR